MSDDSTETEIEASAEAEAPAADVTEATEAAAPLKRRSMLRQAFRDRFKLPERV